MSSASICSCPIAEEAESTKSFSFEIYSSVDRVSEFQWNKQIPESNFLMQHSQLKLIETVQGKDMQFRYVLVKNNDITVGALYFQVVMFHAAQLINYFPAGADKNFFLRLLKSFSEKLLNAINLKMLVSGNVFMTGENGFYFTHDIGKATRAKILRKAANDILQNDPNIKAILISDFYHPKTEFDDDFKRCGYSELYVESDMSIRVREDWKTFDDYLRSLTSKYRVRTKKVFALCEVNRVIQKELNAEEIKRYEGRLHELYHKVMANADFKLAELSHGYFYAQKSTLPDNYHVFAYFKDENIIGFISVFNYGKRMEVHYTGMDMEITKPIHLYQRMMYDMLRFGIENRAERLHFGRTAPEIKSTIGAVPSPMYGYLKHRNPLFNFFLVKPYTANLKPKNYLFRNPFRSATT